MLGVTAVGKNIREAKDKAYEAAGKISFADAHYRKDIAWRALKIIMTSQCFGTGTFCIT